jgi:transposase
MTIDGATDAEVLRVDVEPVRGPTLHPGDIGSMDKLRAHKTAGIGEAMAPAGAQLLCLSPYSPDLTPIERCGSKRKTYLRKAKARTRAPLDHAIAQALATITVSDARGWFHHCG